MTYLQKSGNKYRAKTSIYNGRPYRSKLEAGYAMELDIRQKAGEIKSWEYERKLELYVYDYHICDYKIDFVVQHTDGSEEYVECKGMELPLWKLKWKLLEATFDKHFRKTPEDRLTIIKQSSWNRFFRR